MANSINYSIIIPHRNIPDLLQRCLESIPRREDVQIIVVDDNSDSEKVDFEHFPGIDEPCVEVYFTKEGRGAGYARNIGLKYARGKWLLFADADDFYNTGFLSVLDEYCHQDIDILYFATNSIKEPDGGKSMRSEPTNKLIYDFLKGNDKSREKLCITSWVPWNKMLNRQFVLLHNLCFEEVLVGNDAMFNIRAGELATKIAVEKRELYCLTERSLSLTYIPEYKYKKAAFISILSINAYLRKLGYQDWQLPFILHLIKQCICCYGLKKGLLFLLWSLKYKADYIFELKYHLKKCEKLR